MHHRRSIRLKEYDYSREGMYFVTVRTKGGECVFGDITSNKMKLSSIGEIVRSTWLEIPNHFTRVSLDLFQVMPNHLHGILIFAPSVRAIHESPIRETPPGESPIRERRRNEEKRILRKDVQLNVHTSTPFSRNVDAKMSSISPGRGTLSVIVRTYKAAVTTICREKGFRDFAWHPRFYEHVVRDGKDLDRIRKYILDNPKNWANDENFPGNIRMDEMQEGDESWSAMD